MLPFYRHIFAISEYFVCLLFLLSEPLTAQNFNIQTFTTKDGLSHNDVRAVAVDSSGFLWIATWDGLSRYDGYSFKNYYHKTDDGIYLYDQKETKLSHIPHDFCQLARVAFYPNKNLIWFSNNSMTGASLGLNRVIFTPEYFKNYPLVSEKNDIPAVYAITKDRSGNIWVGIRGKDPLIKITPDLKSTNLKISEIIMCMADGYCTNFFVTGNRKYVSSRNLKHFDEMLEEQNIIRVHHSYLVNINHVLSYSRQGEILLTEGHKAYLGDSYKNNFIKRFGGK